MAKGMEFCAGCDVELSYRLGSLMDGSLLGTTAHTCGKENVSFIATKQLSQLVCLRCGRDIKDEMIEAAKNTTDPQQLIALVERHVDGDCVKGAQTATGIELMKLQQLRTARGE